MADVSKDQLKKEIAGILKNADLTKTSAKKVRVLLEEKLDADLTGQKKVIDDLVMEYLNDQQKQKKKGKKNDSEDEEEDDDDENGDGGDSDEGSEEEEKKKKKPAKRAPPKKKKAASDSEDEVSEEEQASDDEYSPKKKAKPAPKKNAKKKKGSDSDSDEDWGKKKKRGGGGGGGGQAKGYTRPLTLSKDLAKLMGEDSMPRHEVVKRMWALIKERNLYDPKNKQFAICDDDLFKVIGEKRFRIFGMMKYLKGHFS